MVYVFLNLNIIEESFTQGNIKNLQEEIEINGQN